MTRKATHKGHCQICGRLQMLPHGKLSKHGYTVDFGFFNGVCPGAEELPFELSMSLIPPIIEGLRGLVASLSEEAKKLRDEQAPEKVWVREYTAATWGARSKTEWRHLPVAEVDLSSSRVSWLRKDGKKGTCDIYLKGDETRAHCLNGLYAMQVEARRERTETFAIDLERKILGWKPHPEQLQEIN